VRSLFDRRVLPDSALAFVRACQERVPCHLGGGAALSGAFLAHRLSRDVDLFCHDASHVRDLVRELPAIGAQVRVAVRLQRDSGTFVRAELDLGERSMAADLVYEAVPDIEQPPPPIESIVVESLADLRASKITCLLSRVEPRDLVDLLFLEREGFSVERDLDLALMKDGGIDPGVLAWLLRDFRLEPLPQMLVPLSVEELRAFRDDLSGRLRRLAVG
jgi:Nucleotidyl transferase AbiEii toxin, Type IV TA system